MKRYLLLFSLLLLIACKGKLTEVAVNYFDDGTPHKVLYYDIKGRDSILVKSVEYHLNHTIYIEGFYKDEKPHGTWKSWHDNGNLWSIGSFKRGVQVGRSKVYHKNGNLYYSGHYDKRGKSTGTWKFYDENKKLLQTVKY